MAHGFDGVVVRVDRERAVVYRLAGDALAEWRQRGGVEAARQSQVAHAQRDVADHGESLTLALASSAALGEVRRQKREGTAARRDHRTAKWRRDNAIMNPRPPAPPTAPPLSERDIDRLQTLLDALPKPLEPLDVTMLDGYLCGVLLQPQPVPAERWLPHVTDTDGRALPAGLAAQPLLSLVRQRHAELALAIERRQWFDPWVFELSDAPSTHPLSDVDPATAAASEAVYPWVAGFATAMELFPALMGLDAPALLEPLALLYRHLDPQDLEDADELLQTIEGLEPPADLTQAVEELVRATLLLADVSRPLAMPPRAAPRGRNQRPRSGRR